MFCDVARLACLHCVNVNGMELGAVSVAALQHVTASANDMQEAQRLEVVVYGVAEAANMAAPSAEASAELGQLRHTMRATRRTEDGDGLDAAATRARAIAGTELARLEECAQQVWQAYSLMPNRTASIDLLEPRALCNRQIVPAHLTPDNYFDWLYGQAAAAEVNLRATVGTVLAIVNTCVRSGELQVVQGFRNHKLLVRPSNS